MDSLVADYGDSTGESKSENDDSSHESEQDTSTSKLPKPNFDTSSIAENSVFTNPFVEAENAKKAILEKHVKMVPTKDKLQTINGRKICWNYRKGRCRFGHRCAFAHDTDLLRNNVLPVKPIEDEILLASYTHPIGSLPMPPDKVTFRKISHSTKTKKRPGLSDSITPSKKAMKMYKMQKITK